MSDPIIIEKQKDQKAVRTMMSKSLGKNASTNKLTGRTNDGACKDSTTTRCAALMRDKDSVVSESAEIKEVENVGA